jgi:hypothetical protein
MLFLYRMHSLRNCAQFQKQQQQFSVLEGTRGAEKLISIIDVASEKRVSARRHGSSRSGRTTVKITYVPSDYERHLFCLLCKCAEFQGEEWVQRCGTYSVWFPECYVGFEAVCFAATEMLYNFVHCCIESESGYLSRYSYGLDGSDSIPGMARFISPQRPDRLWGPPSLLSNGYRGRFAGGVRRSGRKADHSSASSAEVVNDGAIPPLPDVVMV